MTTPIAPIDQALLEQLVAQARSAPRLRRNHNFHRPDAAGAHRLLNAVEPGSYVAPHRHLHPSKDETMLVLAGRFGVICFDDDGTLSDRFTLQVGGERLGVDIPHGTWHSFVSLAPGSVFFEAKSGPYQPLSDDERAAWAPAEGDPGAERYLHQLHELFASPDPAPGSQTPTLPSGVPDP